ncbi:hypothetical protein LTS18_014843, partial [Coniosporium uncinatum]
MPDLRGCRVKMGYDDESCMPFLDVRPHNSNLEVHLRPHSEDEFESWYAALLCWHPIRPKGIQNKMAKPQQAAIGERRLLDIKRHSEVSLLKEAPIIKVGKMIFWDTNTLYSNAGTPKAGKAQIVQSFGSRRWRRVSCTLRENGELKLYSDSDVTLVSVVQLSQLSRCAIQRLDSSVLDNDFSIAIYSQYSSSKAIDKYLSQPIFLSLESRILYEVWLVLLRAFTVPQLYGPKAIFNPQDIDSPQLPPGSRPVSSAADMFRMERSLSFRIMEARMLPPASPKLDSAPFDFPPARNDDAFYVELCIDGEPRAQTMPKNESMNPFWAE